MSRYEWKQRLIALAGVAVGVAAVLAVLSATGSFGRERGIEPARLVPAPPVAGAVEFQVGPRIGQYAPDFVASRLDDGSPVRLSSFRGQPVFLNFWASWCEPCRQEMPEIAALMRDHPDLVVIGINRADTSQAALRFLASIDLGDGRRGMKFSVAVADPQDTLFNAYQGLGMPFSIFLDRSGRVVAVHNGLLSRDKMEEYYQRAATGTLP
jgi:thiol-disulfide isomerase/thioredoxin